MTTIDVEADTVLLRALRNYVDARSAALIAARKSLDLGELDARALLFLIDHPHCRAGDLRAYLGITSAGTTTLTDRLVERGVIRRDPDEADRRAVLLSAVIDATTEPWAALTSFDESILRAARAHDPSDTVPAARLIADLVAAASKA